MVKKYVCIPRSFVVANVCNQGKTLCSPCTFIRNSVHNAFSNSGYTVLSLLVNDEFQGVCIEVA